MKRSESSTRAIAASSSPRSPTSCELVSNRGTCTDAMLTAGPVHSSLQRADVRVDHPLDQRVERQRRSPAQTLARPARVAHARGRLRGTAQARVEAHVVLELEPEVVKGPLGELGYRVADPAGQYVVVGLLL